MMYAGFAKLLLGADEEAVARLRRSVEMNRNFPLAHFYLAAALAHLGRLDEARSAVQAGLALDPTFTITRFSARVERQPDLSDSARAHQRRDAQGGAAGGMSTAHRPRRDPRRKR